MFLFSGGCTVLVSLFILGKLYVANAGDSRGCLCRAGGVAYPMSFDFTPVTERQRYIILFFQKTFNKKLFPKLFWPSVREKNCIFFTKIVLVIEKNFWNSRLKAENLQNYSNIESSEQFLVTECFFNLFLEVSHI